MRRHEIGTAIRARPTSRTPTPVRRRGSASRPGRPGGGSPREEGDEGTGSRRWLLVAVAAVAIVVTWSLLGKGTSSEAPPPILVGMWTTDDPVYEDRALELTPEAVIFHTGGTSLSYHTLEEVVSVREDDRRAVTFRYRGGELTVYVPAGDSTSMTIQNRPHTVWRRHPEGT